MTSGNDGVIPSIGTLSLKLRLIVDGLGPSETVSRWDGMGGVSGSWNSVLGTAWRFWSPLRKSRAAWRRPAGTPASAVKCSTGGRTGWRLEGLRDRPHRPHLSPRATEVDVVGKIVYLGQTYRFGPEKITMCLRSYHDATVSKSGGWRIRKHL